MKHKFKQTDDHMWKSGTEKGSIKLRWWLNAGWVTGGQPPPDHLKNFFCSSHLLHIAHLKSHCTLPTAADNRRPVCRPPIKATWLIKAHSKETALANILANAAGCSQMCLFSHSFEVCQQSMSDHELVLLKVTRRSAQPIATGTNGEVKRPPEGPSTRRPEDLYVFCRESHHGLHLC